MIENKYLGWLALNTNYHHKIENDIRNELKLLQYEEPQ